MRIGEMADLAGVSVRTVRYYHQRGILSEPERRANGYRDYTVDHLVALVRIRQLVQTGLPLSQAGAIASDAASAAPGPVGEVTLDEIDDILRRKIEDLTRQRARLAEARANGHLGLSKLASALVTRPADIPISVLFAHLYSDEVRADRLAARLRTSDVRVALARAQERFELLDEDTPESELDALADEFARLTALFGDDLLVPTPQDSRLLSELAERDLTPSQRAFLHRLA